MSFRETWSLRLFLGGLALGLALMTFVVTFDGTSFFQTHVASTANEVIPLLGYVLDGAILLSFALTVAGIACVATGPSESAAPIPARTPVAQRTRNRGSARDARRRLRRSGPSATHGST